MYHFSFCKWCQSEILYNTRTWLKVQVKLVAVILTALNANFLKSFGKLVLNSIKIIHYLFGQRQLQFTNAYRIIDGAGVWGNRYFLRSVGRREYWKVWKVCFFKHFFYAKSGDREILVHTACSSPPRPHSPGAWQHGAVQQKMTSSDAVPGHC